MVSHQVAPFLFNINPLKTSIIMAETKEYVWMFDLQDNPMTKDVKEDWVARVRTLRSST